MSPLGLKMLSRRRGQWVMVGTLIVKDQTVVYSDVVMVQDIPNERCCFPSLTAVSASAFCCLIYQHCRWTWAVTKCT
jgi:hypothetical protein